MPARRIITPACRVCGCTEDRACDGGCYWVRVEKDSPPLCSACNGSAEDMLEALGRIAKMNRRQSGGFEVAVEAAMMARSARYRREQRIERDRSALDRIRRARPSRRRA